MSTYNFKTVEDSDSPNSGRGKINYNFEQIEQNAGNKSLSEGIPITHEGLVSIYTTVGYDPTNYVIYTVDQVNSKELVKIDAKTNTLISRTDIGISPAMLVCDKLNGNIWVFADATKGIILDSAYNSLGDISFTGIDLQKTRPKLYETLGSRFGVGDREVMFIGGQDKLDIIKYDAVNNKYTNHQSLSGVYGGAQLRAFFYTVDTSTGDLYVGADYKNNVFKFTLNSVTKQWEFDRLRTYENLGIDPFNVVEAYPQFEFINNKLYFFSEGNIATIDTSLPKDEMPIIRSSQFGKISSSYYCSTNNMVFLTARQSITISGKEYGSLIMFKPLDDNGQTSVERVIGPQERYHFDYIAAGLDANNSLRIYLTCEKNIGYAPVLYNYKYS